MPRSPGNPAGLELRALHPALGCEVVDAGPADADAQALRAALLEHPLLLLRGRSLTAEELVEFARGLGELLRHPPHPAYPDLPEIAPLANQGDRGRLVRVYWHTDGLLREDPPAISVFHAAEVAPEGGDTRFLDARAAYDDLDPEDREVLDGLTAVYETGTRHPMVSTNPDTGRRALTANLGATVGIVGVERESAQKLMRDLEEHYERPDRVYRHRYSPGDTLIWDNRSVAHSATEPPPPDQPRLMLRCDVRAY